MDEPHHDAIQAPRSQQVYTWLFGLSSLWTSLWLGIIVASLNRGIIRADAAAWGGILSTGAKAKGIAAVLVDGEPVAGDGVDGTLLGTTEREDGSTQVTYDGWPLYLFASDAAPGDTNGQGVGEVWFVVGPDGQAIEDTEAITTGGGAYTRP